MGTAQERVHKAPHVHRQDIKQKHGIYSTLCWAKLELLLPLLGGLAATNNASDSNSPFYFQNVYSVCNFLYLLTSPGHPQLLQSEGQAEPSVTRLVESPQLAACQSSLLLLMGAMHRQ